MQQQTQLRDSLITSKYLQDGKEGQTEEKGMGNTDTRAAGPCLELCGRTEKAVGEHSRPHSVHGTEKRRHKNESHETLQQDLTLTAAGTEAGTVRCHSLISLLFLREGGRQTSVVSHSPISLQFGRAREEK